ncbi:MAG: sulfur carrier protein [Shewanella sp.]|jgi:sulfur carrier protein
MHSANKGVEVIEGSEVVINIVINDDVLVFPKGINITGLITQQKIEPKSVAVVCNGQVVPRGLWQQKVCEDLDNIEVFSVVAGG